MARLLGICLAGLVPNWLASVPRQVCLVPWVAFCSSLAAAGPHYSLALKIVRLCAVMHAFD